MKELAYYEARDKAREALDDLVQSTIRVTLDELQAIGYLKGHTSPEIAYLTIGNRVRTRLSGGE